MGYQDEIVREDWDGDRSYWRSDMPCDVCGLAVGWIGPYYCFCGRVVCPSCRQTCVACGHEGCVKCMMYEDIDWYCGDACYADRDAKFVPTEEDMEAYEDGQG